MNVQTQQKLTEALAYEAGQLALRYFRKLDELTIERKGRQDLVSEADRQVETMIRKRVADLFPGDGFLGEEFAPLQAKPGHGTWVVDPIDGTWCFLNGIASWCVSIAFMDAKGAVTIGVIFDPCSGEMFSCAKGLGATMNGKPILVAKAQSFADGSLSVGYSGRIGADQVVPVIDSLIRQGGVYHRHGSGALALAWTAAGRLIGYVECHMNSWDCLAGLLLIEEAGGWIADFLVGNGLHDGNPVVAGPKALQADLEALTRAWYSQ